MITQIKLYDNIKRIVSFFSNKLNFDKFKNKLGRKLALSIEEITSIALFKQKNGMPTKKAVYETLVVNMNRWYHLGIIILPLLMKINRKNQHIIKHIDSTDIPVCSFKNANSHKTMKGLARFGRNSKGIYFGLKLHIITDLKRQLLSVKFTSGNIDDRKAVIKLSKDLIGLFIADAGYVSKKLSKEFYQEHKRILIARPRKKIMTKFQEMLYQTRMLIELNFRNLKMFYNLITSMPRSIDGYFANYIYSLLAYQII